MDRVMSAFVSGSLSVSTGVRSSRVGVCARKNAVVTMSYDMNGSGSGSLEARRIKSSGVAGDRRSFRVTFCLPSEVCGERSCDSLVYQDRSACDN